MKNLFSILLFGCVIFSETGFAKPELLDSIVAVVNDDVVTQSELNRSLTITKAQISQSTNAPSKETLHKQVLEQLINKKLQLQIAQQAGINISDTDIDHIVENVANKNNIPVSSLYERITQDGMSKSEYRDELRTQMTVQKLQQQEVASHIIVTPSEVNTFMHSKLWQSNAVKEYRIEDILIPVAETSSTAEMNTAKIRAEKIASELNKGQTFESITKTETNVESHDLGWRKLSEIPSLFTQQVVNMQPNEISTPIQAGNGFHLVRLTSSRNAGEAAAPERNQVEQLLMQRKFEDNVQNWVSKIRGQAFISMNNK